MRQVRVYIYLKVVRHNTCHYFKKYTMGQCYGSDGKLTPFGAYGVETRSDDRIQPLVDCNEQVNIMLHSL